MSKMNAKEKTRFATAINCIDGRTQIPVINYMKENYEVDFVDMITEPGVDKIISEGKDNAVLSAIRKKVGISIDKHFSRVIAVVGHYDCAGNPVSEEEHIRQISDAVDIVKSWWSDVKVVGLWINSRWEAEKIKEVG